MKTGEKRREIVREKEEVNKRRKKLGESRNIRIKNIQLVLSNVGITVDNYL